MTPNDKNWYSDIEPKLVLETESDIIWSAVADVIIVGLGGARGGGKRFCKKYVQLLKVRNA